MKILLLLFILPALALGQNSILKDKMALDADEFIGKDSYGYTYYLKNNSLFKAKDGKQISFAAFTLGQVSNVDIVNPLKIMVYYGDFNIAVLLDNTLNEIERIDFNQEAGFANLELVSVSNNNSLWVFNKDSQQLEIFNYRSGKRTVISQPIVGDVIDQASNFNFCHLITKEQLITYNVYGSVIAQYQNPNYIKIWESKKGLIGLGEDGVLYITQEPGATIELPEALSKIPLKDLQLSHEFLYIYDGEFVYTFQLT